MAFHQNNGARWDSAQKSKFSLIVRKTKFLESVSFHQKMFDVMNFLLRICIVNAMIFIYKKTLIVKDPHYANFGKVSSITEQARTEMF